MEAKADANKMEIKDILQMYRVKKRLTQEQLAQEVFVTRQAVSRWENGETSPNQETLKALSKLYNVSINTLLGSPRKLVCQCCGMPLEDDYISKEPDGAFNEEFCKWCYSEGKFIYASIDELVDFLMEHMPNKQLTEEENRRFFETQLSKLNHWKYNSNKN